MNPSLDDVLQRLAGNEDVAQILFSLVPKPERELLKRCAVVHTFDEPLVEAVLRPNIPSEADRSFSFDDLIRRDIVERVSLRKPLYRLRGNARKEYFEAWLQEEGNRARAGTIPLPPSLQELSRVLVRYYEAQKTESDLEVLYHLIATDVDEAQRRFEQMYAAADQQFDLARCTDLLEILEQREAILSPGLRILLADYRAYLKTRTLWSPEYYQTVNFYERAEPAAGFRALLANPVVHALQRDLSGEEPAAAFQALLANQSPWILHLYASGGMGKSILLRWLLARKWARERIRCAYIDFDFVLDPAAATQEPWRLLLEIAAQLSQQLPNNPFYELLAELGEYRTIVVRHTAAAQTIRPAGLTQTPTLSPQFVAERVLERFVAILDDVQLDRPVVVILDTLEEVILHEQTRLLALVEQMETLHQRYPQLRLVLSGRYDLRDRQRVPAFADRFASQMRMLQLQPFNSYEAQEYLQQKRGLREMLPLHVVIDKAAGNPFKLAIYADLLRANPEMSEADLRAYPEADLAYLIERIILRLHNPQVQWLLRYGVIPRRLTKTFVREVMVTYLQESMSGRTADDDPRRDPVPEAQKKHLFRTDLLQPTEHPDLDTLWRTLGQYASQYAWISQAGNDTETLVFHADVVNPMRRLLQQHQRVMYERLHRAAGAYYTTMAAHEPEQWEQWIREAIYHQFQLQGADARTYWHDQLDSTPAKHNSQWRYNLAWEVTRPEYAAFIDRATLATAYFEMARQKVAMAQSAATPGSAEVWETARRDLQAAQTLQDEVGSSLLPVAPMALVRAALLVYQGDYATAHTELKAVLASNMTFEDRLPLMVQLADVEALLSHSDEAIQGYQEALALAQQWPAPLSLEQEIRAKLAQQLTHTRRLMEATQQYTAALGKAEETYDVAAVLKFQRGLAEVSLQAGQLTSARQHITSERLLSRDARADLRTWLEWVRWQHSRVKVWMALYEPFLALETCQVAIQEAQSLAESREQPDPSWSTTFELIAAGRELLGPILAELMEYGPALQTLEQAQAAFMQIGAVEAAGRCHLRIIEILLHHVGDIGRASAELERAERLVAGQAPTLQIRLRLLRARLLGQSGEHDRAREVTSDLLQRISDSWEPRVTVEIALIHLVLTPRQAQDTRREAWAVLIRELEKVQQDTARLMLVDTLRACPAFTDLPHDIYQALRRLMPDVTPPAVIALRLAEVCRVTGNTGEAYRLLDIAQDEFGREQNSFALREVLQARDRLGWEQGRLSDVPQEVFAFRPPFVQYRTLCGVMLVEQAERLFIAGHVEEARGFLSDGWPRLQEVIFPSQWFAQAQILRARIAQRQLRFEEATEAVQQALRRYDELRDTYARSVLESAGLDQDLTQLQWRLVGFPGVTVGVSGAPRPGGSIRVYVRAGEQQGTIVVDSQFPDYTTPHRRELVQNDISLVASLMSDAYTIDARFFVNEFMRDWRRAGAALTRILLTDEEILRLSAMSRPPSSLPDLRCEIEHSRLASLPWEFMTLPGQQDEFLSLAVSSNHFYRALGTAFPPVSRSPVERPLVLILQPSTERTRQSGRAADPQTAGLEHLYSYGGFAVRILDDPTYASFPEALLAYSPQILHVSGTLKESPSLGGVYLDFARETRVERQQGAFADTEVFTPSTLAHMLRSASYAPLPLLILDIAHASYGSETVRQLLLRNAFAWEMFQLGAVSAILGIGLGDPSQQSMVYSQLLQGLAGGKPIGQVCNAILEMGREHLEAPSLEPLLPFLGITLFVEDPTLHVLEGQ